MLVLCLHCYFRLISILFQLIVLLKPDFNSFDRFALSQIDKDSTGTQSFVFVIANVLAPVELVIKQFTAQVKMRQIYKINSISRVLQKLLKYFNTTSISTPLCIISSRGFYCHSHLGFE